jgi:ribonucleoside-diphosphate reductase alpha chain
MLKVIIKRDGSKEPFSASKINGWGKWAASSLGGMVDWSGVVMTAVAGLPEECSSEQLQNSLIQACLDEGGWAHNRMAGRLYVALRRKQLYDGKIPTVREVWSRMDAKGWLEPNAYTDQEWEKIEQIIDHDRDFNYAHFQIDQIRNKYSLRDRKTKEEFESPQFTYMRMAMALAKDEPSCRLHHLRKFYDHFSHNRINAPTPNWVNLGTTHKGYASCCLYTTDDCESSLQVGDHIARAMTSQNAGIGGNIQSRSVNDPVRNGTIIHMGKISYYNALAGAVKANLQNDRGGACTTYFTIYDPEVEDLMRLHHPLSPEGKKNLSIDFAVVFNNFIVRKAAHDEDIFVFNIFTAPDLHAAIYSGDPQKFEDLYSKYEQDPNFKKVYKSARKLVVDMENISFETRLYTFNSDAVNSHTPFLDPVYSSNLCAEITEPTAPYYNMGQLYNYGPVAKTKLVVKRLHDNMHYNIELDSVQPVIRIVGKRAGKVAAYMLEKGDVFTLSRGDDSCRVEEIQLQEREPEVAMCNLAAIVPHNIHSPEEYMDVAYYCLKMIDKCIHLTDHPLKHIVWTSKQRMNAGVGLTGVAYYLAKKKVKYTSVEGKHEMHKLAEMHMYSLIRGSLRLAKELGNAPWMHRTKWPQGWLPIDTYAKGVDEYANFPLQFDWEQLRKEIIEQGGIRNSVLVAHMPVESSSKASGGPNGLYPLRELEINKSDRSNVINWAANDDVKLKRWYQLAWDIPWRDMIQNYGIFQKFADQSISADRWLKLDIDGVITDEQLLWGVIDRVRYGVKTTYYCNSKTTIIGDDGEIVISETEKENNCVSGACDV